jgi:hypothetical protein
MNPVVFQKVKIGAISGGSDSRMFWSSKRSGANRGDEVIDQ